MSSLAELYNTHSGKLSAKWEGNLRAYDRLFAPYKNKAVRTLEIGIQNGGSLDILTQYFTNGKNFIGCDIDPACKKLVFDDPRIKLIVGNAITDETQAEILDCVGSFDLIIDDGSHMSGDIVSAFSRYFTFLDDGGTYIVEDLHCSYWQEFDGGLYHPYSSIAFFKYLVDIINYEHWNTGKSREKVLASFRDHFNVEFSEEILSQISTIEFVNSMCVIRKSSPDLVSLGEQVFSGDKDLVVAKALFEPPSQQSNKWSILDEAPAESFDKFANKLKDQEEELTEKNRVLVERDAHIAAITSSISWRLTKPLRRIEEIFHAKQWFYTLLRSTKILSLVAFIRGETGTGRGGVLGDLRFHIDNLNRIIKIVNDSFLVTGWSVSLSTCSAVNVRIKIGNCVYQSCIVSRFEVSQVFASICSLPEDVGFICVPLVPKGLHYMRIEIQGSDGEWVFVRRALLINIPSLLGWARKGNGVVSSEKNQLKDLKAEFSFDQSVAVTYLVRGADENWLASCERFIESYKRYPSGIKHTLYVIFKGFTNDHDLEKAKAVADSVPHKPIYLNDDNFDIGAYIEWANMIDESFICVFNTASEILASEWLFKFAVNLSKNNVGLVGATASYESLNKHFNGFPVFPNIHIRSTAFMINREYFCSLSAGVKITDKFDALHFESGLNSLTRKILSDDKKILLVGRNGEGYAPPVWPKARVFRQGEQENLLVADNQTRNFDNLPWEMKKFTIFHTWGAEYVK